MTKDMITDLEERICGNCKHHVTYMVGKKTLFFCVPRALSMWMEIPAT